MVTLTRQTMKRKVGMLILVASVLTLRFSEAQVRIVTVEEAVQAAVKQNLGLRSSTLEVDAQRKLKQTAVDIPKTQLSLMYGQYNSINKDNNFAITQSLPFPTVFTSQSKLGDLRVQSTQFKQAASQNELVYQVMQVYETLKYIQARQRLLERQDSLFAELVRITSLQYATGEATLLQKTSAETRYNEVQNLVRQNLADQLTYNTQLKILMNSADDVAVVAGPFATLTTNLVDDSTEVAANPQLAYHRSLSGVAAQEKRVESNKALPDLTVGYFNQTLTGFQLQADGTERYFSSDDRFSGFTVGLAIPIWFVPAHARVKASSIRSSATQLQTEYMEKQLYGEWKKAVQQFEKHRISLDYYTRSALPNAKMILRQSMLAYRAGDISQADHRLNLQQALGIEEGYIQTVLLYNQSIITLEFLSGKYSKN